MIETANGCPVLFQTHWREGDSWHGLVLADREGGYQRYVVWRTAKHPGEDRGYFSGYYTDSLRSARRDLDRRANGPGQR